MTGFKPALLPADGSLGRICTYRKGALLWSRDAPISSVFVVRRGEIEVFVPGPGEGTVVRRVKPGEICGLLSFSDARKERAHSAGRASVRTEVLQIPRPDFIDFLSRKPDMLFVVLTAACERLAYAEERIHVLSCRGAEDRILTLLLQLAERNRTSSSDDPNHVLLHYTHSELARCAAMTRSHVSTVLARLREKHLVRYDRGSPLRLNVRAAMAYIRPRKTVAA